MTSPADPPALRPVVLRGRCPSCKRPWKVREGAKVSDVVHQCDLMVVHVDCDGGVGSGLR